MLTALLAVLKWSASIAIVVSVLLGARLAYKYRHDDDPHDPLH
jgi:hypothetical protein